jgi:hypothetical protein
MRNESPVGLATYLGLAPFAIGGVVFVVLLIKNGGDVEAATALSIAIIGGVSLVGTAALRQWRAVVEARPSAVFVAPAPAPAPAMQGVEIPPGGEFADG